VPLSGRSVGKDRKLTGRVVKPGKLQSRVQGCPVAGLASERLGVAVLKARADSLSPRPAFDQDEAPRLTEPNRRSQAGELDQSVDGSFREIVRLEPAYISAPHKQIKQAGAELVPKSRHHPTRCSSPSTDFAKPPGCDAGEEWAVWRPLSTGLNNIAVSVSPLTTDSFRPAATPEAANEPEITSLTLLELWAHGHSPNFMRILLEYWRDHGPGTVRAIVTQQFLDAFPHVFEGFTNVRGSPVRWAALDAEDEAALVATREFANNLGGKTAKPLDGLPLPNAGFSWALLDKYFTRYPTRHILLMNLEENLIALGSQKRAPASISGIIFSPGFHYRAEMAEASFRMRAFISIQDRLVRDRILSHPDLRGLFFLDQAVVNGLKDAGTAVVAYLPDPVRLPEHLPTAKEVADTRRRFGVPPDRKLFLLFGDLRPRKGLWKLFAALVHLTPEECAKVSLAIVGHAEPQVEERIAVEIAALADKPIAVVRESRYVSDQERDLWFDIADVILAPYIRHIGSSGVLMLAAAHRKPSISQDFGLMGRLTRENRLGVTADTRDPRDLARAMRDFLGPALPPGWDPEVAYAFAKSQPCERFGAALVDTMRPFMT
jgi:glycosyltransferase involved in cell wall biosynthesis